MIKNYVILFFVSLFLLNCKTSSVDKNNKLTPKEQKILSTLYEEEKLAHDVYNVLYQKHKLEPFKHILESEQRHMNAISTLLENYSISYKTLENGKFNDKHLQKLYDELTNKGLQSETNAYEVGATIEDLDIFDIENMLKDVEKEDIEIVLKRLQCGSRNHLRAFTSNLESYSPLYINQTMYDSILNDSHEKCGQKY